MRRDDLEKLIKYSYQRDMLVRQLIKQAAIRDMFKMTPILSLFAKEPALNGAVSKAAVGEAVKKISILGAMIPNPKGIMREVAALSSSNAGQNLVKRVITLGALVGIPGYVLSNSQAARDVLFDAVVSKDEVRQQIPDGLSISDIEMARANGLL